MLYHFEASSASFMSRFFMNLFLFFCFHWCALLFHQHFIYSFSADAHMLFCFFLFVEQKQESQNSKPINLNHILRVGFCVYVCSWHSHACIHARLMMIMMMRTKFRIQKIEQRGKEKHSSVAFFPSLVFCYAHRNHSWVIRVLTFIYNMTRGYIVHVVVVYV